METNITEKDIKESANEKQATTNADDFPRHYLFDEANNYIKPDKEKCVMAVNTWERRAAKSLYLWGAYMLAEVTSKIVLSKNENMHLLGMKVVDAAEGVIEEAQLASTIYIQNATISKEKFEQREKHLDNMISWLYILERRAYYFAQTDQELNKTKPEKYFSEFGEIIIAARSLMNIVKGVQKKDKEVYNKNH